MKKYLLLIVAITFGFSAEAQEFDLNVLAQEGALGMSSADYDAAFEELDEDKSGFLSEDELLKFQQTGLTQEKDETFSVLDINGDGVVNENEYKSFFKEKTPQNAIGADLSVIFRNMDTDQNGNLSPEELKDYRQKNLDAQNREIFRLIDVNNDNQISKEEFAKFMTLTKSILGNLE